MSLNLAINKKIEILLEKLFLEVPIVINFIQKDKTQKEYGCSYYPFWRKTSDPLNPQPDFANARWQEVAYALAFLYSTQFPDNKYYKDPLLGSLIKPVLLYWVHIQNRDGSFSEWLKDGYEYPPTAFGLQRMVETFRLCPELFYEEEKKVVEDSFRRAGIWLMKNTHLVAINHECGGLAALAALFSLWKSPENRHAMDRKMELISKYQNKEGWFMEIDGPDIGYNTVSITQLALAYNYYPSNKLKEIIKRALSFNSYFIYPDGMMGGGMNSRLAMNLDPLGFAMLSRDFSLAAAIALYCLDDFVEGRVKGTYNSSDYQRCSMLGHMFLFCYWLQKNLGSCNFGQEILPSQRSGNINYKFNSMGTAVVKTPLFYLATGPAASLGAAYSYKARQTLFYSSPYRIINNSGIYIETGNKIYYSASRLNWSKTKWGENFQICWGRLIPVCKDEPGRWLHPGAGGIAKKKFRKYFPRIYAFLRGLNQLKAGWEREINLVLYGMPFRRELFWEEHRITVKNWTRLRKGFRSVVRENICIPAYTEKGYELLIDGHRAVPVCQEMNLEFNDISRIAVKIDGECLLTFVFPYHLSIKIRGPGRTEEVWNAFSNMNAWGIAIEMSPQNPGNNNVLEYYIDFA